MLLFVGLGNPGSKYENHRHNVGFMAVDEIVRRHNFLPEKKRWQALTHEGRLGSEKVIIVKPQTYMNESGRSIGEAMRFFKLTPAQVFVFYDELDLAFGKLKVKKGGGAAGHNGIRSTMAHIGPDFNRVRIGIGHPGDKSRVHGHVLGDFSKAETPDLEKSLDAIAQEC
ncbi:MAG: aminoacyl-tRNA hydrolase, partial [Kordiimonas sp.]